MRIFKFRCRDCGKIIWPSSARKASRLCRVCEELRAVRQTEFREKEEVARLERERRLKSGEAFLPSSAELDTAKSLIEFISARSHWTLRSEVYDEYKDGSISTVEEAIHEAESREEGFAYFVSNHDCFLQLDLNSKYGVCSYLNEQSGDWLYAYTDDNLKEQVDKENHVVYTCSCCGEGLHWYPSSYHMPRETALQVVRSVCRAEPPANVSWLPFEEDISHISPGHG